MTLASSSNVKDILGTLLKPEDLSDVPSAAEQLIFYCSEFVNQKLDSNQVKLQCQQFIKDPQKVNTIIDMLGLFQPTEQNPTCQGTQTRRKSIPWTPEEDKRLTEAVTANGTNNWGTVANIVGNNRTRAQCSQRWNRVIDPRISKENWTPEEEEKLLSIVARVGTKAWTRVASDMGNRSDVQCRFKYNFIMDKRKKDMEAVGMIGPEDPIPTA